MKRLLYFILLITAGLNAGASDSDNRTLLWKQANEAYQQKQYDSAAAWYEQIAAIPVDNATLYYNLGNTYYKLNRVPEAVLNYERALFLEPGHRQAAENLVLTQSRITSRIQAPADIFFVHWWAQVTSSSNATAWALVSLFSFLLLLAGLSLRRQGILSLPVQSYFFLGILTGIFLVFAYRAASHKATTDKAVVMGEHTPMMAEPGQTKTQRLIPQGTTVRVNSGQGNWLSITLPDGRTGHMQRSSLSFVQPGKH